MTENIIIAILLFAAFATLLILLISNRRMRKNSEQPTLRELERQYKKFGNMIKSKKMRKAKELEEINDYDFN